MKIKALQSSVLSLFFLFTICQFTQSFAQNLIPKTSKKLKVLVISDLNGPYGTTGYSEEVLSVMDQLPRLKPDLILLAGDMVAGQKRSLTDENLQAMWDSFEGKVFQKIKAAKIPFGFTLGNHDASASFISDREIATKYWMEQKQNVKLNFVDDTHYPLYYSYLQNEKFFISWDASAAKIPDAVYKWMSEQLKQAQALKATHRVIIGHLPLYAIVEAKNKPGEVNDSPAKALQFFKDHNVDMYISGHQHAYYPAKKDEVILFNAGAIGDGPRTILGHSAPAQKAFTILKLGRQKSKVSFYTINPSTRKPILLKDLPSQVKGFNGVLNKY